MYCPWQQVMGSNQSCSLLDLQCPLLCTSKGPKANFHNFDDHAGFSTNNHVTQIIKVISRSDYMWSVYCAQSVARCVHGI